MTEFNFFTVKGGQGCSVTAAAFAVQLSTKTRVLLVDMAPEHDLASVLGCVKPEGRAIEVGPEVTLAEADDPLHGFEFFDHTVYDWGTNPVTNPDGLRWLVTRQCYIALKRYMTDQPQCNGVILVTEEGRALDVRDVEAVIGVPVLTEVPIHPAVARSVDAGLLAARISTLSGPMKRLIALT